MVLACSTLARCSKEMPPCAPLVSSGQPTCWWGPCRIVTVPFSDSSSARRLKVPSNRCIGEIRAMGNTYTYDVVIIGAGPAGMCGALYAGRSMLRAVVLERGFPGGELL